MSIPFSELIKTVRELFDTVEDISNREEEAAKQLGQSARVEKVKAAYGDIEKVRKEYIKQGMSDNEALEKAKQERLKILNLTLQQEEEYYQETVDLNNKYSKELNEASFWKQGLGLDRTNSQINQDIKKSWAERMNQLATVESLKKQIEGITNYTPVTDKKYISC